MQRPQRQNRSTSRQVTSLLALAIAIGFASPGDGVDIADLSTESLSGPPNRVRPFHIPSAYEEILRALGHLDEPYYRRGTLGRRRAS